MVSHHLHRRRRRPPYSTSAAICMFTAATTSLLRYYFGGSGLGGGGIGHPEIISCCRAFQFSPHQQRRSIVGSITRLRVSKFSRPKSATERRRRSGDDDGNSNDTNDDRPKATKSSSASSSSYKTIADMMRALEKDPNKFITSTQRTNGSSNNSNGREVVSANLRRMDAPKRPTKRTRARVDRPKQSYVYASQKRAGMVASTTTTSTAKTKSTTMTSSSQSAAAGAAKRQQGRRGEDEFNSSNNEYEDDGTGTDDEEVSTTSANHPRRAVQLVSDSDRRRRLLKLEYARSLGLDPATQFADAIVGTSAEDNPYIVSRIRLDIGGGGSSDDDDDDGNNDDVGETSSSYAYVLYKPAGWGILGEKKKSSKESTTATTTATLISSSPVMEMGNDHHRDDTSHGSKEGSGGGGSSTMKNRKIKRVKAYDEEIDDYIYVDYNEDAILAILTPKERMELMKDGGLDLRDDMADLARTALVGVEYDDDDDNGEGSKKRKRKVGLTIDTSSSAGTTPTTMPTTNTRDSSNKANLETPARPSITNWLKELKASEGTSVRGGKHWVALSGATEIDDSGLVLLCPRDRTDAIHVDCCTYITVIGNGKNLCSRSRLIKSIKSSAISSVESCDESTSSMDIISRIRTGRIDDPIISCRVTLSDGASTSNHAVLLCQDQLGDGVRGDATGDPLDRRSWRRLVHCETMTVSSLVNLDDAPVSAGGEEGIPLPDDISNYVNRRDGSTYVRGSFLGRQMGLSNNQLTNAYREINGAADGYPGWYVDRYDKWLFVQQEVVEDNYDNEQSSAIMMKMRGPLPSLHDGYTTGVYYLPIQADRSIMGSERQKPILLEGMAAPEFIPVMENGVKYLVNLGDSFSTGIFLDQRHQRAYLTEICNKDTRVLNCFAHTGAFSVAAAVSGAKTVSLDLDKKWLDRVRPLMELNDILEWEGRHDVIYGDCFDWLVRLAKRNEQFDVVILDPPSTSVGKKKKRWSVKSDMAELVTLAAPLVKSDGLLFTTTNSASLRTEKFVNMCQKGLMDAGITNAKLERVSPMPSDFSSIGPQPVRNLVWRLP